MELNELLDIVINKSASDLHLVVGYSPAIRIDGTLYQLSKYSPINGDDCQRIIIPLLNGEQRELFYSNKELDFAISYNSFRFRVNLYYAMGKINASFRLIPNKILSIEDLSLPSIIKQVVDYKQGLVLVVGSTGEGKSTTLASIINEINFKYNYHIITIEDPIEYVYPKGKSIISQRELRLDTLSSSIALKSALREDPDVIMIGEMRDFDTISLVLTAAETGHLVFSTLHTNSTSETINRIIDIFPSHQQNQIKSQLASVLKMIISQRLLPKNNQTGRIVSCEILINNSATTSLIREGKTHLISNVLETGEGEGQILFEKYLLSLYQKTLISYETAFSYALRPKILEKYIKKT